MTKQPRLRLIHNNSNPEDALFQANKHLAEGQPEKAIKLYTEVLYKLSPASVIAFLNRSLAYICLDLPELAVVDAYRAGMVVNQMREDTNNGLAKYQAATRYLRTEKLHVNGNEPWTSSRRRFIRGEWAYTAISNIVINDVPEPEHPGERKHMPFNVSRRQVVCIALEIRAIYRLCGALYLCGGGARSDALGLIDDAGRRCRGMEEWEWIYFHKLGNLILAETMQPWDNGLSDSQGPVSLSKAMQRKQEEEIQKTKECMRAKTSAMKLSGYDWDVYEPELDRGDWQKLLRSWVQKSSSNCAPYFVQSNDIWDEAATPYAELRADRDINAGELVLSERTAANVSTSIPEDVFEHQSSLPRRFFCDACSALLIIPSDCSVKYNGSKVPLLTPPPQSNSPVSRRNSAQSQKPARAASGSGSEGPEDRPMFSQEESDFNSPSSATVSSPSPQLKPAPKPTAPSAFMFCCPTHDVPTCSPTCRRSREPFDPGLCHTSIERDLRNNHLLDPPTPKPLDDRKRQCLLDLLFLRTIAKAFNTGGRPLQDHDLVFASSGPSHQGYTEQKRTWSFLTHVIRPIRLLDKFLIQSQTDHFTRLEDCDGWIINTLMSKIDSAMRVSKAPRYTKIFDQDGNLESAFTPFDEQWHDVVRSGLGQNEKDPEPWKDKEPWIASIHPIFNLIRVANPAKGEKPNVAFVHREGVKCYAVSGNGLEPAIKKGELLLRASDEMGMEGQQKMVGVGGAMKALLRGIDGDRSGLWSGAEGGSGRGGHKEGNHATKDIGEDDGSDWFDYENDDEESEGRSKGKVERDEGGDGNGDAGPDMEVDVDVD